jgi:outer membrane protein assembly factor BamA
MGNALCHLCVLLLACCVSPGVSVESAPEGGSESSDRVTGPRQEDPKPGLSAAAFPVVFSSPETGFGGGAGVMLTYRSENADIERRPQSLGVMLFYTKKKQALAGIAPELSLDQDNWRLQSTIGYSKFPTSMFGIGNDTPEEAEEDYTLEGGSVQAFLLRRIYSDLRAGLTVDVKKASVQGEDPGGLLDRGLVHGYKGGFYSGLGPSLEWDSRDNSFTPGRGEWFRLDATFYTDLLDSDTNYEIVIANLRHYRSIRPSHVLAGQILMVSVSDVAPFHDLAKLGDVMRGIYAGRVIDRAMLSGRLEYRFPLKGRFGGVAFGSLGDVADGLDRYRIADLKFAGGGGLRFALNQSEGINLRVDLGFSRFGSEVYVQFLEAF